MSENELDNLLISIREELEKGDIQGVMRIIEALRPADQADVVRELEAQDQITVLTELEPASSADLLEEMEDEAAVAVVELLEPEQIAEILNEMELDEVADVLNELPDEQVAETLELLDQAEDVQVLMSYPKDTAGGIMTAAAITLRPNWTVLEALNEIRRIGPTSDSSYYLYVIDKKSKLLGVVGLRQLVSEAETTKIKDVMETRLTTVLDTDDQELAAQILSRYSHLVLPVVNKKNQFLGVVTADDLIEVTQEEATEDMYKLVGISGEERIAGSARDSIVKRLPWLAINMATLFVAITIIDVFDAVIAGLVIVAVFLPLVSGEGGNAGSQTTTVIVRGLATGEMSFRDSRKVLIKEVIVSIINGALIGLATGVVALLWKGEPVIAIAIFIAMIFNFMVAAVSGVLIPLGLMKLKVDPALASAAFVSAFTDTFGFLFFLGIVSILL